MITAEDVGKLRQQYTSKQIKKGKVTADMVAQLRQQYTQPTSQQPINNQSVASQPSVNQTVQQPVQPSQPIQSHSALARQGQQQIAQKQQSINTAVNKPMTSYVNNGGKITDEASLAQFAREQGAPEKEIQYQLGRVKASQTATTTNTPRMIADVYDTSGQANKLQAAKAKENNPVTVYDRDFGKKEAKEEFKQIDFSNSKNGAKYLEYQEGLKQAIANNDTRNMSKYQTLIKDFRETFRKKYAGTTDNTDIVNMRNQLNDLNRQVDELYGEFAVAQTPEERQRIAEQFNRVQDIYTSKYNQYADAILYDETFNNNIWKDTASSFGKGVTAGTARAINGGWAVINQISGLNASNIDSIALLKWNNGERGNSSVASDAGDTDISGATMSASDAMYALTRIHDKFPDSIKLNKLYNQIRTGTYKGTSEDLAKDLDEVAKDVYQTFKDKYTQDELDAVAEQLRHNEIYGNAAAMPNAFETTGEQVFSGLVGYATGGVASLAGGGALNTAGTIANNLRQAGSFTTMGLAAGSGGLDQAIEQGGTYNQGLRYGVLKGATEVGTEMLGGETVNQLFGRYGKTALGRVFGKAIDNLNIESKVGRFIANQVNGVASEMTEEMISEALDPLWQTVTYNPSALPNNLDEMGQYIKNILKAGADAIPSTLLMQGSGMVMQARNVQTVENSIIKSINENTEMSQIVKNQLINEVRKASREVKLGLEEADYIEQRANTRGQELATQSEQMKQRIPEGYSLPQSTIDILSYTENNRPGLNIAFDTNIQGNGTFIENSDGTRTITLNPNSKRAVEFTLTHELGHDLKGTEEYTQLQNLLIDYAKGKPKYQEALNSLDKTYRESGASYNLQDEATNDMLGQAIGEQEFYNKLAENPTLFNRITNKLKSLVGNKDTKLKNKIEKLTRNAYQSAYKGVGSNQVQNSLNENEKIDKLNEDIDLTLKAIDQINDQYYDLKDQYNSFISSTEYKSALSNITKYQTAADAQNSPEYQLLVKAQNMKNQLTNWEEERTAATKRIQEATTQIDKLEKEGRTPEKAIKQAKKELGTTNNFKEAGYLLEDGTLLDFSGRSRGSRTTNQRTMDHREINEFGYDMDEFIELGNIRLQPESNGFQLMKEPTEKQYNMLKKYIDNANGEVFIDIYNDGKMTTSDGAEYKANTPTSKIIDDLKTYFKTGKFPSKSQYADFLYSKQNGQWQQFVQDNFNLTNGTRTNFLPTNEELQESERKSVAEDAKALNMEQKKPNGTRKKRLTQQERDANIQAEIENRVVEAVGNNFDKEILLKRLQEASQEADKKSNIEAKTQADEDSIITNRRIRTILDDFIHDIKQGKDIRQNQVYMAFSNPDYEVQEGNVYVETNVEDDGTLFSLSEKQQQEVLDYARNIEKDNTLSADFASDIYQRLSNVQNYSDFENIKQEVQDYKDKMYKGISGLEDIANLKPEDVRQNEMTYKQLKDKNTANQRKFFENVETSPVIAEETKNRVNATTYEQKHNLDTLEEVRQKLDERGNDLVEEWKHKSKNFTDKDVALGAILVERYQQEGDWQSAARTVEKLADMGTEAGRAVQMYSIFQRLSPETMAIYQQKELNKAFEEMKKRKTGKWIEANKDKFKLTAEDTQFIYDQVEKASQAIDEETKQRELSKIENRINEKLPPDAGSAIKTLRRIAMLFNPKTQVRNIIGNTLIMPVNDVADFIGTAIDKIVSKKTGVRTTSTANIATKAKGFARGAQQAIKDYKTGTRTTASGSKFEFEIGAKPFNENTKSKTRNAINRKLNGLNNLLSAIMSGGDRPFYEAAYQNSLESQMKANKVAEPTQDMIDIAVNEALQRTWNDDNEYTKTVLGIRKAMNKVNVGGFGLGDLIVPFAKTPANLTKAMVEYSPAGFIGSVIDFNNMRKAISRGEMTASEQKRFVSSMSKAITGTLIYLIAGTLAKSGRITGSADDDKDVKNFEQNVLGIQPYSVRIGDKTYTYSWANPLNAPLAIMADTYKMSKENASTWEILNNAFKVAGETLVDNSFLSGVKELFSKDSISEGIVDAIESFPESLIPTFMSQIASLGDNKQRQTFEYQNDFKTITNRIKNKIPGVRNTLEPQVNTFGEEIENQNNVFNAFINPANVREASTTESQKALYDVYQETKDKTIFPMQAPYYTNTDTGEKKNLSSKERVAYQKASGQYVTEVYDDLFNNEEFNNSYHIDNEAKTTILKKIAEDGNAKGREAVGAISSDTNSNLDKLNERNEILNNAGIPLADYYLAWYAQKDQKKADNGKLTAISHAVSVYNDDTGKWESDLTSEQKNVLYEIFNAK